MHTQECLCHTAAVILPLFHPDQCYTFREQFWSIIVEPFINKDKKRCLFYIFKLANIVGTVAVKGRLVKELADLVHCPF